MKIRPGFAASRETLFYWRAFPQRCLSLLFDQVIAATRPREVLDHFLVPVVVKVRSPHTRE